jgi:hypothetical protein
MKQPRIAVVALLTSEELRLLGSAFNRAWPVDETACFSQLLQAIDEADRQLVRERDAKFEESASNALFRRMPAHIPGGGRY